VKRAARLVAGASLATIVMSAMLASCKRTSVAPSDAAPALAAPSSTVVVLDAGATAPGQGRWSCAEGASRALPSEPVVGALALATGGGAPAVFTFVSASTAGDRRHRAWELGGEARTIDGPPPIGDAPPWTPVYHGEALRFVRLEPGASARVVVADRSATLFEVPLPLGDELAVDAAGAGASFVLAASSARGVEVRAGAAAKAESTHVIADAYAPIVLVGVGGTLVVAARIDAPLEAAKVTREVTTANLEGAGQERIGSSIVVVTPSGQRLASHPLPAGSECLGATATRDAILVAATRVVRGARTVDVDAIQADGRRERIGEFPVRRAARLYPVAGPPGAPVKETALIEVVDDGAAVLGARAGTLPVRDVEAVVGARVEGDAIALWLLRADDAGRSLVSARCDWRAP
jgi:hypothetical protein